MKTWSASLTLYVTDLGVLGVTLGGDVDLCARVLLDEIHDISLLADQPPDKLLVQEDTQMRCDTSKGPFINTTQQERNKHQEPSHNTDSS